MGMGGGGLDAAGSRQGGSPADDRHELAEGGGGVGVAAAGPTQAADRSSDVRGGVWPLGFSRLPMRAPAETEALGSKNGCAAISSRSFHTFVRPEELS